MPNLPGQNDCEVFFGWSRSLPEWRDKERPEPLSADRVLELTGVDIREKEDSPAVLVRRARRLRADDSLVADFEVAAGLPASLPRTVHEEAWKTAAHNAAGHALADSSQQAEFDSLARGALKRSRKYARKNLGVNLQRRKNAGKTEENVVVQQPQNIIIKPPQPNVIVVNQPQPESPAMAKIAAAATQLARAASKPAPQAKPTVVNNNITVPESPAVGKIADAVSKLARRPSKQPVVNIKQTVKPADVHVPPAKPANVTIKQTVQPAPVRIQRSKPPTVNVHATVRMPKPPKTRTVEKRIVRDADKEIVKTIEKTIDE